ncbi:MAG: AsmA-like C-terminal region-containing protein [Sphingobacteriales bacterium]
MARLLKITLWTIAGIVVILALLFFGGLWYINSHKEKVLKLVNTELNQSLDGNIIIGDMQPDFFKRFPNISLKLSNVLIRDKRFAEHHRTLLDAKNFAISVNAWALLKGTVNINHIDISNAAVDLYTDSTGYSNESVFKKSPKKKKDASTNNYDSQLGRFTLTNVNFKVEDQRKKKEFDFIANDLSGTMANPDTGWNTSFHMDITAKSMAFNTHNGSFIKDKELEGNLTAGYNQDSGRLWVRAESLDIGDDPFEINAVFETLKKPSSFTIHLAAKQVLWRRVSALLSANIKSKLDMFNITRPIAVKGIISGSFAGGGDPSLYVTATVNDNTVITPGGTINDCSFAGVYTNEYQKGKGFTDDNSVIRLVNMKGTYRNMPFVIDTGSIINLNKPMATGNFRADFPLTDINEILGGRIARFSQGTASMRLQYKGDIVNYRLNKPEVAGSIAFRHADFKYIPETLDLHNCSVALYFKNNDLMFRNIRLQSGQSVINMDGRVNNFMNLYYDAPKKILFTLDINSPQLYLGEFLGFLSGDSTKTKKEVAKAANSGNVIDQLSNVLEKGNAEMHLRVANVHYFKFLATDMRADLLSTEDQVIIQNVGLKHAGGFLKLNGSVTRGRKVNQLALKTSISHVDVHEFFTAFDNFGLKDFTADNLTGFLSARTNITAQMSDEAKIIPGSINGPLDVNLQDGALVNFNPIGSVAKFAFPFRDLKNIKIKQLDAHFDAHGELITIYPFKFSSSAINMDVAGVYGLNSKGTDITLDIPLRNPKKDSTIVDQQKLEKKRYKGVVLHIRAKSDSTGKIKIGFNKDKKKDEKE